MSRRLTALAAGLMAAALPAAVQAALLWTLVSGPLTAVEGQPTVFTFTGTSLGTSQLGCFWIDPPSNAVIGSVGTPVASYGRTWVSGISGSSFFAAATKDTERLRTTESVTFTVTVTFTSPGAFSWTNHAHTRPDCTGTDVYGTPLLVTVLPAAPTPTPKPTATPTPTPSSTPTPSPTVSSTATATSTPTVTVTTSPAASTRPTPQPAGETPRPGEPTPTPTESPRPTPSPSPRPGPDSSGTPAPISVAPFDDGASGGSDDFGMGFDVLALLSGPFTWFVPGAAVGVPGLLVIIFVGLQALGVMAWIPAVRRMGDADDRPGRKGYERVSRSG